jgi:hypothetical protein
MDEVEVSAIIDHLIAGDQKSIPQHRVFAFNQWVDVVDTTHTRDFIPIFSILNEPHSFSFSVT